VRVPIFIPRHDYQLGLGIMEQRLFLEVVLFWFDSVVNLIGFSFAFSRESISPSFSTDTALFSV